MANRANQNKDAALWANATLAEKIEGITSGRWQNNGLGDFLSSFTQDRTQTDADRIAVAQARAFRNDSVFIDPTKDVVIPDFNGMSSGGGQRGGTTLSRGHIPPAEPAQAAANSANQLPQTVVTVQHQEAGAVAEQLNDVFQNAVSQVSIAPPAQSGTVAATGAETPKNKAFPIMAILSLGLYLL